MSSLPVTTETNAPVTAKPFVKWAGGKQALAPQLINHFTVNYRRYYEPFLGGGSVFLCLRPHDAVVSDHNRWLMDTYRAIRDDWRAVAAILDTLPNNKETYLKIRASSFSEPQRYRRAAYFIYLNKTCFRGLFRVNQKGEFNVPYGAYQRRYYDSGNLEAISYCLRDTDIRSGDFELALHGINAGDFAYFDPPYYKLGGYSDFNRYTEVQFREQDHLRLAALCRELDFDGVRWAVSNSNTPFVRHLFNGFNLREVTARREINLNSKQRKIVELLITNF